MVHDAVHDPHHGAVHGAVVQPMPTAFFGNQFVDISDAHVPITTHALHYGTAVFEGIRSYGDKSQSWLFRAYDHYKRLLYHASLLQMETEYSAERMVELTVELLGRNDALGDAYIRPLIYSTSPRFGAGLGPESQLVIYALPMGRAPAPRRAASTMISKWRRFPAASCPSGAKICGLYINSSLARADAQGAGFDQPILLTHDGDVSEGFGANIFAVFGSTVITPPADADILPGITRDTLLGYFKERGGFTVTEERFLPERLPDADELFFCGTGMEISPIGRVGETVIGDGKPGPLTTETAQWYRNVVTGQTDCPTGWRIPVRTAS